MNQTQIDPVVAVFDHHADAERARDELVQLGISAENIVLESPLREETPVEHKMEEKGLITRGKATLGGMIGAIIGGLIGTLAATGSVGGVAPLLDGGGLAALVGGLIGLAVGGLLGALIGWSMAADWESFFAREVQSGQTVVKVRDESHSAEVAAVLRRHGGWSRTGQTGSDPVLPPGGQPS